ncbi:MAG TPA: alpha/beta hydrolase, partial [Rhodopila sp.]|uniref:alpha/beta fold hydrolase n=1 Tax=Rhodopila sp. TaxID=2480087 RepID=UPI002C39CEDF
PAHHRVMAPTLVLWGERDRVTPPDRADGVMQALPGASLAMLSGLGHMPQEEDPAASLKPVAAFLAR